MLSKIFFGFGILNTIYFVVLVFVGHVGPMECGGVIIAAASSFVFAICLKEEHSGNTAEIQQTAVNDGQTAKSQPVHFRNGTYYLLFSALCGIRLLYRNLIGHYGSTSFQEICILITGITLLLGGIILKMRYRKEMKLQDVDQCIHSDTD